jgi:ribosome modulation factor
MLDRCLYSYLAISRGLNGGRVAQFLLRPCADSVLCYESWRIVPIRLDMPRPRAEGFKAFMDGEEKMSCPYKRPDPKNSQWHAGYEEAREEKAKRDAETYR